jgi:GNAT superfamily N-acetyltransferase
MRRLELAPEADLGVFYEADARRYASAGNTTLAIVTRDVFIAYYRGCPSIGFQFDGLPIGGIIFDGSQAHIAVLPAYHGRWALLLKPALEWLFGLKREILVEVEAENRVCVEFMRRNGWRPIRVDSGWVTYRMTRQTCRARTAPPRCHSPNRG